MSGAGFILAINLFVAGLLSAAFMMIAVYDRSRVAARWLALGYAVGMGFFAIEAVIPALGNARLAVVAAVACLLAGMIALNVGVARKYHVAVPWRLMGALFVASLVVNYAIQDLPRYSLTRMTLYQAPFFLMMVISVGLVWNAATRDRLDRALMILFGLSAIQFLTKPFLAYAFGGWGARPQDYISSNYALFSQSMATVFAMATALLLMVILVRDVLTDATQKSETDTLSGLLNRRGFEEQAEPRLARANLPASLILADLDAFKSINDEFGHDTGDQVIVAFARLLRDAVPPNAIVGRLGGEEFGVFLPDTNAAAARLLAESLRLTFAALNIPEVPLYRRCTASFGVAERIAEESLSDLRRRSDAALYAAKRDGRDRVAIASSPGADVMPLHPLAGTSLSKSA